MPPSTGLGRIDNRDLYTVLYAGVDTAEAAIAEAFGRLAVWRAATFVHHELGLPYGLATYKATDELKLFDLDSVAALQRLGIERPSDVVTRDRSKTQAWAKRISETRAYAGAVWWSYYKPEWRVAGLWCIRGLHLTGGVHVLTSDSEVVRSAAREISRYIA